MALAGRIDDAHLLGAVLRHRDQRVQRHNRVDARDLGMRGGVLPCRSTAWLDPALAPEGWCRRSKCRVAQGGRRRRRRGQL